MANFLLDHNFVHRAAILLRERGHNAVTARDVRLAEAADPEYFVRAATHEEILLTFNAKDFRLLQYAWRRWTMVWQLPLIHHGVISIPQNQRWDAIRIAQEVGNFMMGGYPLQNELYEWDDGGGWKRYDPTRWYPPHDATR
ncbi:MAG: DUF5615 family PIN-like protein [Nitrolancea sp.]